MMIHLFCSFSFRYDQIIRQVPVPQKNEYCVLEKCFGKRWTTAQIKSPIVFLIQYINLNTLYYMVLQVSERLFASTGVQYEP